MQKSKAHKISLNVPFNDLAHIRSDTGFSADGSPNDPDAHLSYEQRQTKEDLLKIAHQNPEEVLAGRIAPLNIETKKFSTALRKQKEHVSRLLLYIQLEQIRTYFAQMQSQIQDMLDQLREMRLALLKAIKQNSDLLDLVETARNDKQLGRTDDGTFINEALQYMVEVYMKEHGIPKEAMKDYTLEQMLAMVEEQSEQITLMNVHMSDQVGVIDKTEKDLIDLSKRITAKQEMLDSDAPDDIKKQTVADFYDEVNLNVMEDHIKRWQTVTYMYTNGDHVKAQIKDLSNEVYQQEAQDHMLSSNLDSLMAKL